MDMEVAYYKKLFQTIGNIIELIEKDDIPKYIKQNEQVTQNDVTLEDS